MCPTIRHLDHFSDETVTAQVFFSDLQTSHCFWAFQMQMYFMFGFLLREHWKMHHDQNAPLLSSHMREGELHATHKNLGCPPSLLVSISILRKSISNLNLNLFHSFESHANTQLTLVDNFRSESKIQGY